MNADVCAVNNQEPCARLLLFRGADKEALNFGTYIYCLQAWDSFLFAADEENVSLKCEDLDT